MIIRRISTFLLALIALAVGYGLVVGVFSLTTACTAISEYRVTTPAERAQANELLAQFEVALETAIAAGAIRPEHVPLARNDIAGLRELITQSETIPTTPSVMLARILGLTAKWLAATK